VKADVKGMLLGARMRFLAAQGDGNRDRVLASLSEGDRAILGGVLLPNSWYPSDLLARLDAAIAEVLVHGDRRRLFAEMGRFSAQANLGPGGMQRPYLQEGDTHIFLRHVPRMYTSVHSSGRRTYEKVSPQAAVIRTFETGAASVDDCLTAVGWLQRGIELSGGSSVRVFETQCRAKGAAYCEYRCDWR